MKKSKFTESARRAIVAEQKQGKDVDSICRDHQISSATFYKWKNDFRVEQHEDKRRLKELERENARLKKMYAELSIDHEILNEGYKLLKKWQAQDAKKK